MNKALFERYAELKKLVSEAEEEIDTLKPQIVEMMGDNEEVQTDFGTFIIGVRRIWEYPEVLAEQEKELKAKQKEAQQLGTAVSTENSFLIYKQV